MLGAYQGKVLMYEKYKLIGINCIDKEFCIWMIDCSKWTVNFQFEKLHFSSVILDLFYANELPIDFTLEDLAALQFAAVVLVF